MQEQAIEGYRLSPQQEHLWLLQQSSAAPYCSACAILIEGRLQADVIDAVIQDLVERNAILRTGFRLLPAMTVPLQVVSAWQAISVDEISLDQQDAQSLQAAIDDRFAEACRRQFDFEVGPLLKVSLAALSPDRHLLIFSLPALSADIVGLTNLVREVAQYCGARLAGEELMDKPVQYADLSEWQNELLESEEEGAGRRFWKQKDYSPLLTQKLALERTPAEATDFYPALFTSALSHEVCAKLASKVRQYATTEASFLQTCWHTLLWVRNGQSPVIVGVAHDGRKYDELKEELGLLAKHLPTRVSVEEGMPFSHVLSQVDAESQAASKWQEYFCWDHSNSADEIEPADFAQFAFEYLAVDREITAAGLKFSILRQYACIDRFKLKLLCVRREDELSLEWHFDRNLYSEESVRRLAAEFAQLVESAVSDVEAAVAELDVISERERQQILGEWNETAADFGQADCIHTLFEEQARRTPERVAVVSNSSHLTFAELDRRADRLARRLTRLGVGPDVRVGVCLERSLEMVVGLLGVLKAGGAYVPVDPGYPAERVRMMIEDAGVAAVVSKGEEASEALSGYEGEVVRVEESWGRAGEGEEEEARGREVGGGHLAYVIYTSGSTGRPKGVMIEHRSICNRLLWIQDELPLSESDSLLQKTSISFDASVWEVFVPLLSGARLILAKPGGHQDAAYMVKEIQEKQVTTLQVVPTMLDILLAEAGLSNCKSLKRVYCGGEVLDKELRQRFYREMDAELHNLYGPTEVSIDATHWACDRQERGLSVPIGKPLPNMQVFILNGKKRLKPIGVEGELYVAGRGLARGYLNRADLTAERFVPNPFGAAGSRLYRTGDLAIQTADGVIEYVGRIDHQVKVRGYRIELGEIESVLSEHPAIREVIVVAREENTGGPRIIAYVVPDKKARNAYAAGASKEHRASLGADGRHALAQSEAVLSASELRAFTKSKLPEYMVPAAFVILDAFPLTPNGKIDRRALPPPDAAASDRGEEFTPPRTPVEKALADIWAGILGIDQVSIKDNFFEIGGHSLLATQMASRVREAFAIDLELRVLFDSPQLAQLAAVVEEQIRAREAVQAPPIRPVPRGGPLPLSYAQARLWFIDQMQPGSPLYNVPMAARVVGELSVWALWQGLEEIVRRHESLRTVFRSRGGKAEQEVKPEWGQGVKVIDISGLKEEERKAERLRLGRAEGRRGFELERGPLVRGGLVKVSEEEQVVMLTMHHIISDGWSVGVMIRELSTLYEAYVSGRPSPLEELEVQYADYAVWQRQWLEAGAMQKQVEYWTRQLEGAPEILNLPTDRPRSQTQGHTGSLERFRLGKEMAEGLKELSQREGATLFMGLLAAFQTLLYRLSNQTDIVVGTDIANRNNAKVEGLIGFFGNQLVLRTQLAGNLSFRELLARVKEVTANAYAHQDLPFDKLVEVLNPNRRTSRTPLFQVKLVLQNVPAQPLALTRLTTEILEGSDRVGLARFDLLITFVEAEQGLDGVVEYSTELFDRTTILRMLSNLEKLVGGILAQPDFPAQWDPKLGIHVT